MQRNYPRRRANELCKEKNKMIVLLGIGIVLATVFFYGLSRAEISYMLRGSFISVFLFVAIVCYPLAIAYGKGQIIAIFQSIHKGVRQPFTTKHGKRTWQPVVNLCIAFVTIVFFGWVYGVYHAFKQLQMLKSYR